MERDELRIMEENAQKKTINYDDFAKLDIRVGSIVSAEKIPETDKLLRLEIDIGEEKPRQIVAGIAEYIEDPQTLIGKQIPILANLEPKMLRGYESQGMTLAVSADGGFSLLHPGNPVSPGSRVA